MSTSSLGLERAGVRFAEDESSGKRWREKVKLFLSDRGTPFVSLDVNL
jgi:hypothetical protein